MVSTSWHGARYSVELLISLVDEDPSVFRPRGTGIPRVPASPAILGRVLRAGMAGDKAAAEKGTYGMKAGDIARAAAKVLKDRETMQEL